MDFMRKGSLILLLLHFYVFCYRTWEHLGFAHEFARRLLITFARTGLFNNLYITKISALVLLLLSLVGIKGKKDEKIKKGEIVSYMLAGSALYYVSVYVFYAPMNIIAVGIGYTTLCSLGYLFIMAGGTRLSRLIKLKLTKDIFNTLNETFPQTEQKIENEYSINLPARYNLKGKVRSSWINIINPFRGVLVVGSAGAGKTFFVIRHVIEQHIRKGFACFIYDFKYPDLSKIAYNFYLKHRHNYKVPPTFYVINFDKPIHRCNPLDPKSMTDITDAIEASRTILLGLNREFIKRQGEFFVESPINFVSGAIWFLRKYQDGKYCTLAHAIELIQIDYDRLFPVLGAQKEIEVLINPFTSAYINGAAEQLEGQIASAKIALARLSSPLLYWVLTGDDFSLDINDPEHPKIVCVANNPEKSLTYGAVISLYVFRLLRVMLKKDRLKSSIIIDELPSIFLNGIEQFLAVARGYKAATVMAVQDFSQLRRDYGREHADVIINVVGNILSGQTTGDTAKQISERLGRIVQERESISINRNDTSSSRSTQLDAAVPASRIATLSSGEFVGVVSDNPDQRIEFKAIHAQIVNDLEAIKKEESQYVDINNGNPVTDEEIHRNYLKVKDDVALIIQSEMTRIEGDPSLQHLLIVKEGQ
ncbi:conjugal transfer protein TraG [Chitinophaga terrae (ex Kim and Jung 2007)]|nr:conjugal transfer protein TraG [Chitinophaga terrae (ex Kim and Jung 2007)]